MPWCETCDRFYNPNSMAPDGTCMKCGSFIAKPEDEPADDGTKSKAPWHFKLLLVVLIIYLTYRLIQGIVWVAHHL
jgi:hypothetical protein